MENQFPRDKKWYAIIQEDFQGLFISLDREYKPSIYADGVVKIFCGKHCKIKKSAEEYVRAHQNDNEIRYLSKSEIEQLVKK